VPDGEIDAPVPAIRGFARIGSQGDLLASAGVVSMRRAVWSDGRPGGPPFGAYCFKLAFTPVGAVGTASPAPSPAGAVAWTVSTAVPPIEDVISFDGAPITLNAFSCPEDHRDAAVVVRRGTDSLGMPIGGSVFVLFL
jgi:hypothetical protein